MKKKKHVFKHRRLRDPKRTYTHDEMQRVRNLYDSSGIDGLPVIAFAKGTAVRETFRIWWQPHLMGNDFFDLIGRNSTPGVLSGASLEFTRLDVQSAKEKAAWRKYTRNMTNKRTRRARAPLPVRTRSPVRVQLRLDETSYLTEPRTKIVTLDRRYPGEVFGLLHDFYREVYAEDEKLGGKAGPTGKSTLVNRGRGPLVWGHDIGDLVIQSVRYKALRKKKGGPEGEFTFMIGS